MGLVCSPWPEQALRANIHAQISLALNRIYTEWYPSKGYSFNITNSTSYDQYYVQGREVFEVMQRITDDIFNTYVRRQGNIDPYYTEYCDGKQVTCKGMKQWGTVSLAEQGKNALQILQYYYGSDIEIVRTNRIQAIPESYPGTPLRRGSTGTAVRTLQRQLNRIAQDYPSFGTLNVDGVFGAATEEVVKKFQKQFSLTQDGVVGRSTWYKISYIYVAVKKLAELSSEGVQNDGSPIDGVYPGTSLRVGSTGAAVEQIQFWLSELAQFDDSIPAPAVDGIFGSGTENAVRAFQSYFGLTVDGVIGPATWNLLYEVYTDVANDLLLPNQRPGVYPGSPLRQGSTGTAVREIQYYLYLLSAYYNSIPPIAFDGIFGPATTEAVKAYQQLFGLTVDGIVGPATWNSIYAQYQRLRLADGPVNKYYLVAWPGQLFQTGSTGQYVQYIQFLLQYIGFFYSQVQPPKALDGIFGTETEIGVKSFQQLFGLPQTGQVDQTTWDAMLVVYLSLAAGSPLGGTAAAALTDQYPGYVLALGSAGTATLLLQQAMNQVAARYCSDWFVPETGVFDQTTQDGVEQFQRGLDMQVTGTVDRATWDAIQALQ